MPADPDNSATDAAERLLRAARPSPAPAFVERTEASLLGHARPARRRPVLAALGLTGGLAALVLGGALVGAGPLGRDDDRATARDDCRALRATTVPRGELVRAPDGRARVVTRPHHRTVTRCDR